MKINVAKSLICLVDLGRFCEKAKIA